MLPAVPSAKIRHEATLASPADSIENKRLLLVEDQAALATSLQALLAYLKLQTRWVVSGEEAIELLKTDSNFDFVLSDVHMPGIVDGVALARWIHAERPGVKVLLMSGYHDVPFEELEIPVLPKPFTLRQLASFLSEN